MRTILGFTVLITGFLLIIAYLFLPQFAENPIEKEVLYIGAGLFLLSIFIISYDIQELQFWKFMIKLKLKPKQTVGKKSYKEKPVTITEGKIKEFKEDDEIPGASAKHFKIIDERLLLSQRTAYNYGSPNYILNADFRILDWNEAFSLAFDHTIEGRRGECILEWVFYLDNAEAIIKRGKKIFKDPANYPMVDFEDIYYNSLKYGPIVAHKIAAQVRDDQGKYTGWVITLDLDFQFKHGSKRYFNDLRKRLEENMIWTEYAMSYDRLLEATDTYPVLINQMVDKIPDNSLVLDLGAGTGNATKRLLDSNKRVLAVDNNDAMLDILRNKCSHYLATLPDQSKLIIIKQNCENLAGIEGDQFDVVLLNNVLYSLGDPEACLKEVSRILKWGGEIRISGPKKDTNIDTLFNCFKSELINKDKFDELRNDYDHVYKIHHKESMVENLYRFDSEKIQDMLKKLGFKITHLQNDVYAGQGMIIFAKK